MREAEVIIAFDSWLKRAGWTTRQQVDFCDIVADRGRERLYVEAKGKTMAPGLDVDTAYGQLLRRMNPALASIHRVAGSDPSDALTKMTS